MTRARRNQKRMALCPLNQCFFPKKTLCFKTLCKRKLLLSRRILRSSIQWRLVTLKICWTGDLNKKMVKKSQQVRRFRLQTMRKKSLTLALRLKMKNCREKHASKKVRTRLNLTLS